MTMDGKILALGAATLLVGGCGSGGGASLPAGETNFGCGAAIYAAVNLVDSSYLTEADKKGFGTGVNLVTKYATAYAQEEKIQDGMEAFNKVKLEAYAAKERESSDSIVARARKCAGLPDKP